MNIGVVVYSQTGNTLQVAEKVRDRLIGQGHSVNLEQVTVAGGRTPQSKSFELENKPTIGSYDAVVFASYVEAFSLCPVMSRYMKGIGSLAGKRVACLVTQHLPYPWMGGNRAVKQLRKLCLAKGATVDRTAVVNWTKSKRNVTIATAVDRLAGAF